MDNFSEKNVVSLPRPSSDWYCIISGEDYFSGIVFRPAKGEEPNWFWRKMHYLMFGFKWKKLKGKKDE